MLVKYIRDGYNLVGCVVAISADKIGYSFCNPQDRFNKAMARDIAAGRAAQGTSPKIPHRLVYDGPFIIDGESKEIHIPSCLTLEEVTAMEVEHMKGRAERYYKPQPQGAN